jgi:predicted  nucleic acid-binding Zn-ribbon protein
MAMESDGNWSEYAKLVLAELERHNRILAGIESKLDSLKLQQALYEREIQQFRNDFVQIKADLVVTAKKVENFESIDIAEQAVQKYRKYIIGLMFAVITSILIPILKIVFVGP